MLRPFPKQFTRLAGSLNSAVSSQASLIHDFTAYLQQARAWHAVMDSEPCAAQQQSMDASTSTTVDPASSTLRTVRRSVPAIFFSESFDVQDPATFHTACPVGDQGEGECIAALEGHLDMVRHCSVMLWLHYKHSHA